MVYQFSDEFEINHSTFILVNFMSLFHKFQTFVTTTALAATIAIAATIPSFAQSKAASVTDKKVMTTEQMAPKSNSKSVKVIVIVKPVKGTAKPVAPVGVKPTTPPVDEWAFGPDGYDKNGFNKDGVNRAGTMKYNPKTGMVEPRSEEHTSELQSQEQWYQS